MGAADGVPGLAPGLSASVRAVVTDADTAELAGSGDVPVLATPRLLALAEAATVAAVAPYLAPGTTSVGTLVSLEHRRASPVGAEVEVEAELTEVAGRRLVFSFIARDIRLARLAAPDGGERAVVGAGTVERVMVDRGTFLARLQEPGPDRPAS
ncbi:MAG: thioesterase family protein [Gemmatimonadota bacterium]